MLGLIRDVGATAGAHSVGVLIALGVVFWMAGFPWLAVGLWAVLILGGRR